MDWRLRSTELGGRSESREIQRRGRTRVEADQKEGKKGEY